MSPNNYAAAIKVRVLKNIIVVNCEDSAYSEFTLNIARKQDGIIIVWFQPPIASITVTRRDALINWLNYNGVMYAEFDVAKTLSFGNWGLISFAFDRIQKHNRVIWHNYDDDTMVVFDKFYKLIMQNADMIPNLPSEYEL